MRGLWLGAAFAGVLAIWPARLPPVAFAHATYIRSDPPSGGQFATPGRIRVIFTEGVDVAFSELQVLDVARRRVDNRDTAPVQGDPRSLTISTGALSDGNYLVSWRTLSAVDGHAARGVFPLVVGAGGSTDVAVIEEARASPLEVALRALAFAGTLGLVGGAAFLALVMLPLTSGAESNRQVDAVLRVWERRFRRLGVVLALVALVSALGWLASQIVALTEGSSAVGPPAIRYLASRTGLIWLGKVVLLAMLAESFWRASRAWLVTAGLAMGAGALLLTSLTSHAAAIPRGTELTVAMDWLHQLGAAIWLGGLGALLLLVSASLRAGGAERLSLLARVVPRFSGLALGCVGVIVVTGVFGSLVQVGSPSALGNLYGWALITKVGALVPMVALGAVNLLIAKPRYLAGLTSRARAALQAMVTLSQRFRLALTAELALGGVILLATGLLTAVEPGKDIAARQPRPLELQGPADDLQVLLRVEPGRVGQNRFTAIVSQPDGHPAVNVQRVQLRFTYLDQELGQGSRIMERQGQETFTVDGNDLSVAGRWQIELAVRRLDREDAVAAYRFDLGVSASEGAAIPLPAFTSSFAPLTMALLVLGLAATLWALRYSGFPRPQRRGYALACSAVALTSAMLLIRSVSFAPDLRSLRNPIAPSSSSLARGEAVYQSSGCLECHGVAGRGDGPTGRTLNPRPADFRVHMAAGHTDGELFDWVSNGVPGTAMPPYRDALSEEDRWNVINYIRRFAAGETAAVPGDPPQ